MLDRSLDCCPRPDPDSRLQLVQPRFKAQVSAELERLATTRTGDLVRFCARHFGLKIPAPIVRFDLRGRAAGQARTVEGNGSLVRYNPELLIRNPEDFLASTVPHETAHLVAFHLFGPRIKPHGHEWQSIMRLLGAEPRRCHDYDTDGLQTRRLTRYMYKCGCGSHQLTSIRHNRILDGRVYLCRQCGLALRRARDLDKEPGN
jgi:SprT protein